MLIHAWSHKDASLGDLLTALNTNLVYLTNRKLQLGPPNAILVM